jgi:3-oxoadipate enol-lactonase
MKLRSDDIELSYETVGKGAPAVFLHPFPTNHEFWTPICDSLSTRYTLVLPDLRGHGDSGVGDGPATMEQHAEDIRRLLDELNIGKCTFLGCSIGGYILFEFWRRHRERVNALVFMNTKASADSVEARATRLLAAESVHERGPEQFIDSMLPKLMGESTHRNRPDIVADARRIMMKSSSRGIAEVQRGMAERPDSIPTLSTIGVPTLVIAGEEDVLIPLRELDMIHRGIRGSELRTVAKAGHFAAFERPQDVSGLLREFLGRIPHGL